MSGIKNIKTILNSYNSKEAEIYFHQDLDGITSALAMKSYIKKYNFSTTQGRIIQYGGLEFKQKIPSIGKIPILVDFAHSKPMFKIATDHHDSQSGSEYTDSTHYKIAPSNVETLSCEVSTDLFTSIDIKLINTIDSADFYRNGLSPSDITNSIFKLDKSISGEHNRFKLGIVVNRLILSYKNKLISGTSLDGKRIYNHRNLLECLLLDCNSSLISIYNNLNHYIKNFTCKTWNSDIKRFIDSKLDSPIDLEYNLNKYQHIMKGYNNLTIHNNVATQIDASGKSTTPFVDEDGNKCYDATMFSTGSYDRYTVFNNYPNINFYSILWTMGLIQVSGNPFKKDVLKGINLGHIKDEIFSEYKEAFSKCFIDIYSIKKEAEMDIEKERSGYVRRGEDFNSDYVGFTTTDLNSFYKDMVWIKGSNGVIKADISNLGTILDKPHYLLCKEEINELKKYKVTFYDIVNQMSGGHASITNLSGFNYFKYSHPKLKIYIAKVVGSGSVDYQQIMKKIQEKFMKKLNKKIEENLVTKFEKFIGRSGVNEDLDVDGFGIKKGDKILVGKEECVVLNTEKGSDKEIIVDTANGKKVAFYKEKDSEWTFGKS